MSLEGNRLVLSGVMANHLIAKFYKEILLNLYYIVKVYLAFLI